VRSLFHAPGTMFLLLSININYCCWSEGSVDNGDLAVIHAKSANVGQSRVSPIATLVCMHATSFCLFLCFRCWFLLKIIFHRRLSREDLVEMLILYRPHRW
jgi:hypothetical protein